MTGFDIHTATAIGVGVAALSAITAAGTAMYLANKPYQYLKDPSVLLNQSTVLEDGSRVAPYCPIEEFKPCFFEDVTTTYEAFLRGLRVSNNGRCLAKRISSDELEWLSYQEVHDLVREFGSGLINNGLKPDQSTFIGIYSANRFEWDIVDLGCTAYSMVSVPLYDTLNPSGCAYVINHTDLKTVVCDSEVRVNNLLNQRSDIPVLERIISFCECSQQTKEQAESCNIVLLSFSDIIASGKAAPHSPVPSNPEDIHTICYTSGTTGEPKGVIVKQINIIAQVSSIILHLQGHEILNVNDSHLSYLPLAHMYERVIHMFVLMHGASIAFFRGDIRLLLDDFQAVKPAFFFTVPRLVNKIYDKVLQGVQSSWIKNFLFQRAMKSKMNELQQGIIRNNSLWDKLVFKKVSAVLGGKVKFVVVSSAPLSVQVLNFIRCALGVIVIECYGSSEMCGCIAGHFPGEFTAGHVGGPVAGYRIKLMDIPEMDYYSSNSQGEICVKGVGVCEGYYKNPTKTAELIDSDGWSHSGDIAEWTENGTLKVIGRKKDIFKLSQGEYIAIEKLEIVYLRCPTIQQIFVTGNSLNDFPVAVVVPEPDVLLAWAKSKGYKEQLKDLCIKQEVVDYIQKGTQDTHRNRSIYCRIRTSYSHFEEQTSDA